MTQRASVLIPQLVGTSFVTTSLRFIILRERLAGVAVDARHGGENISTFDPGSRGGGCEEMMRRSRRPTRWRTDPPRAAAVTSASARFWSLFLLVGLWGRGRCPRSRLRWGVVHFCPRRPLPPSLHPLPPYPTLFSCGLLLRTSLADFSCGLLLRTIPSPYVRATRAIVAPLFPSGHRVRGGYAELEPCTLPSPHTPPEGNLHYPTPWPNHGVHPAETTISAEGAIEHNQGIFGFSDVSLPPCGCSPAAVGRVPPSLSHTAAAPACTPRVQAACRHTHLTRTTLNARATTMPRYVQPVDSPLFMWHECRFVASKVPLLY